jgi:hypothetical protein
MQNVNQGGNVYPPAPWNSGIGFNGVTMYLDGYSLNWFGFSICVYFVT